jgi:transcriptional regulator with XRE-family HTH domain
MDDRYLAPDGAKLRAKRLALCKTQEEVAHGAPCALRTLRKAEQSGRVRGETLDVLARYFRCSVNELLPGHSEVFDVLPELRPSASIIPAAPRLVIGRQREVNDLRGRLCAENSRGADQIAVLTAVRGLPGVGKTTVAATLARDAAVRRAFPDGVLWATLGTAPNVRAELSNWAVVLGCTNALAARTVDQLGRHLAAALRDQHRLLIVDDIWREEHAEAFRVGGQQCATLFTSRARRVAEALAAHPARVYHLDVLSTEESRELLAQLAPEVVRKDTDGTNQLLRLLGGLPLSLQVAGRLLQTRAATGSTIEDLTRELTQDSRVLLEAQAPVDMSDVDSSLTPTVAALLRRSVTHLDEKARWCLSMMAGAPSSPATFDVRFLAKQWRMKRQAAIEMALTLVAHGLMEPADPDRFQMHSLLIGFADTLGATEV